MERKIHHLIYIVVMIGILILAGIFRMWDLTEVPPSLSWDEVAIGYNAWSILKTGNDEYGIAYPFLFRSFDDYKLPGMVYTVVFSELLFGLNEFAVRLPSALFGIAMVIVAFFLGRELLGRGFGVLFSLFAAVNPWLVNFSRQAFESNGAALFTAAGTLFLILSRKRSILLIVAAFCYVIGLYFYYSSRVVIPVILIGFVVTNLKWIGDHKKMVVISFVIGLAVLLPLGRHIFSQQGFSRISQVVVTADPLYSTKLEQYTKAITLYDNAWWARIVYNRRRALIETIVINYAKNLSPSYLFVSGLSSSGLFFPWEFITIIAGILFLITNRTFWRLPVIGWLLSYPLVGALTKDQPNALRTLVGAPGMVFISALGCYYLWILMAKRKKQVVYSIICTILLTISVVQFIPAYIVSSYDRALQFGDGYKQLSLFLKNQSNHYDNIWVTGQYWRPYIHLLFHLQYDPLRYQQEGWKDGFGIFHFGKAVWDTEGTDLKHASLERLIQGKTLFVLSNEDYIYQQRRGTQFTKAVPIDGRVVTSPFWAVEL